MNPLYLFLSLLAVYNLNDICCADENEEPFLFHFFNNVHSSSMPNGEVKTTRHYFVYPPGDGEFPHPTVQTSTSSGGYPGMPVHTSTSSGGYPGSAHASAGSFAMPQMFPMPHMPTPPMPSAHQGRGHPLGAAFDMMMQMQDFTRNMMTAQMDQVHKHQQFAENPYLRPTEKYSKETKEEKNKSKKSPESPEVDVTIEYHEVAEPSGNLSAEAHSDESSQNAREEIESYLKSLKESLKDENLSKEELARLMEKSEKKYEQYINKMKSHQKKGTSTSQMNAAMQKWAEQSYNHLKTIMSSQIDKDPRNTQGN